MRTRASWILVVVLAAPAMAHQHGRGMNADALNAELTRLTTLGNKGRLDDGAVVASLSGLGLLSESQTLRSYLALEGYFTSQEDKTSLVRALEYTWRGASPKSEQTLAYLHMRAAAADGRITPGEIDAAASSMNIAGARNSTSALNSLRDDTTFATALERGGRPVYEHEAVGSSITVTGSPEWLKETLASFEILRRTKVGREIIRQLEETGKHFLVGAMTEDNGMAMPRCADGESTTRGAEHGCAGTVAFNPYRPGRVATLGHELLHVLHYAQGIRKTEIVREGPWTGTEKEELQTMGLGEFKDLPLTENALREELNGLRDGPREKQLFDPRTTHYGEPDMRDRGPQDSRQGQGRNRIGVSGKLDGIGN